jgi:hypothetical protein
MGKEERITRREEKGKKPFNETKFGKFLDKAKEVASDKGEDIVNAVGMAISGNYVGAISKVGKALIGSKEEGTTEMAEELFASQEDYINELELIFKDKESARDMQKEALAQEDLFSKRFVYYFATLIFLFSATIITLLFFVEIPQENKRIVDMAIGIIVGTGLISVIQFFFGSSKGSKDKTQLLNNKK